MWWLFRCGIDLGSIVVGDLVGGFRYGGACEGRVGTIALAVSMQCQGHGLVFTIQCRGNFLYEIHIYNTVV